MLSVLHDLVLKLDVLKINVALIFLGEEVDSNEVANYQQS